ncbi:hypothetical protein OAF63_00520 [Saprospiraceae bacterium]|jgi:hypothetical protein|nr:hypothetical protein [Bacteroidota bacterium]MDB4727245.1 hypothetical protein [Saprospiraceae bacterium]MDF1864535.1 hypothetical protein [Saprospiraceae bacterium]
MEQFKNIDPLDDWLKSMKDASSEPASEVWEALSGRIPKKPSNKRRGFWLWGLLLIFGLSSIGYLLINENEKINAIPIESKVITVEKTNKNKTSQTPIITPLDPQTISNSPAQKVQNRNRPTAFYKSPNSLNSILPKVENPLKIGALSVDSTVSAPIESSVETKEILDQIKSDFRQKYVDNLRQIKNIELKKLPVYPTILAYDSGTPKGTHSSLKPLNIYPLLSVDAGMKLNHFPIHKLLEIDDKNAINAGSPIQTYEMGLQMNFEINSKWMVSWNVISRKNLHFEIINNAALAYSHSKMETNVRGVMTGTYDHDVGAIALRSTVQQAAGTYYPEGNFVHTEFKLSGDWTYKKSSLFVYRRFIQNKTRLAIKAGVGLNTLEKAKMRVHAVEYSDSRILDAHMNIMLHDLKKRYVDGALGLDFERPLFPFLSIVFAPEINIALSPVLKNHSNVGFGLYGGLRYRIR